MSHKAAHTIDNIKETIKETVVFKKKCIIFSCKLYNMFFLKTIYIFFISIDFSHNVHKSILK